MRRAGRLTLYFSSARRRGPGVGTTEALLRAPCDRFYHIGLMISIMTPPANPRCVHWACVCTTVRYQYTTEIAVKRSRWYLLTYGMPFYFFLLQQVAKELSYDSTGAPSNISAVCVKIGTVHNTTRIWEAAPYQSQVQSQSQYNSSLSIYSGVRCSGGG